MSEPATKADLEKLATKDELGDLRTAFEKFEATVTSDISQLRGAFEEFQIAFQRYMAASKADSSRYALKDDLEAWGFQILATMSEQIRLAINASFESVNDWMKAHAEQVRSEVAAANANTGELRRDFEAHRDDTQVHRTPRRRRS